MADPLFLVLIGCPEPYWKAKLARMNGGPAVPGLECRDLCTLLDIDSGGMNGATEPGKL